MAAVTSSAPGVSIVRDAKNRSIFFFDMGKGYHEALTKHAQELQNALNGVALDIYIDVNLRRFVYTTTNMRESVDGFQFTSVIQLPGSNVTQTGEQQSTAAGPAIDTNTTNRKSTQSKRGKPTTRKVQRRVPRPRNSWILYRSEKSKLLHTERPGLKAVDISSLVSEMWAFEPEEVKQYYTHLAEIEARQHREKYPEYRYTPQARATKN